MTFIKTDITHQPNKNKTGFPCQVPIAKINVYFTFNHNKREIISQFESNFFRIPIPEDSMQGF